MASARHLAGRFVRALWARPLGPADDAWVRGLLHPGEQALWDRMSVADQAHAAGVARAVDGAGVHDRAALAAALLHDVGKVSSGLGTLERVPATLLRPLRPRRWRAYYDHAAIGAALLEAAGSDPLVVAWAREHHLPPDRWTVPADVGHALKAADDD